MLEIAAGSEKKADARSQNNETEQAGQTQPAGERTKRCSRQSDELSAIVNDDNETNVAASTTAASCRVKISVY